MDVINHFHDKEETSPNAVSVHTREEHSTGHSSKCEVIYKCLHTTLVPFYSKNIITTQIQHRSPLAWPSHQNVGSLISRFQNNRSIVSKHQPQSREPQLGSTASPCFGATPAQNNPNTCLHRKFFPFIPWLYIEQRMDKENISTRKVRR